MIKEKKVILATGANGALGSELKLMAPGNVKFVGTSTSSDADLHLDVTNFAEVKERLVHHQPDIIFHLAAIVPIPIIEKDPDRAFIVNVLGLNNVLRAVEEYNPDCKVVVMSSSEVYGNGSGGKKFLETDNFDHNNFYAFTKVSQEELALLYLKRGLKIKIARIFNYSSIYKKPIYSLESFANQIVTLINENKEPSIKVGNLQPERDFLQGADVATALYFIGLSNGLDVTYNISRGSVIPMFSLLEKMINAFGKEINVVTDDSKFRRIDNMYVCGDNTRLINLGWMPKYSIDEMILTLVNHYKRKVSI